MGTAAYGGKGFKGMAAVSGNRPIGVASYKQQHTCVIPPPPPAQVLLPPPPHHYTVSQVVKRISNETMPSPMCITRKLWSVVATLPAEFAPEEIVSFRLTTDDGQSYDAQIDPEGVVSMDAPRDELWQPSTLHFPSQLRYIPKSCHERISGVWDLVFTFVGPVTFGIRPRAW